MTAFAFFCAPFIRIRSPTGSRIWVLAGMTGKTARESLQNPMDKRSSQHNHPYSLPISTNPSRNATTNAKVRSETPSLVNRSLM